MPKVYRKLFLPHCCHPDFGPAVISILCGWYMDSGQHIPLEQYLDSLMDSGLFSARREKVRANIGWVAVVSQALHFAKLYEVLKLS